MATNENNNKEFVLDQNTSLESAANVHGLLAVKKDGSGGAVGLEEIANEAGKKVGDAVKITGNVLPVDAKVNKTVTVFGGSAGKTLTFTGGSVVIKPNFQSNLIFDVATKIWSIQDEVKQLTGLNGKTSELFNATKESGYSIGDQVFFNSAIWQATSAASTGQSPDTNPEKWGTKPVLSSGINYVRKNIILKDLIIATGKRYTPTSSTAPGYSITDVSGRVILSDIPVTAGATYVFKNMTIDGDSANIFRGWLDGHGDRIGTLNDSKISPFTHVAPRDAKSLLLSFDGAHEIATAVLEQTTLEIDGYPIKEKYSIGYNLSNGNLIGYAVTVNGVAPNTQGTIVSKMIPVKPKTKYCIYGNYFAYNIPHTVVLYDKDFNILPAVNVVKEDRPIAGSSSMVATLHTFETPDDDKVYMCRYNIVASPVERANYDTVAGAVNYFFEASHWKLILQPENPFYEFSASRIDSIFQKQLPVQKQLSEETILLFGTSIENTDYAQSTIPYGGSKLKGTTGGWIGRFLDLVRPQKFYNYAAGGYTLTDTSGLTGPSLATGGTNSFLRQLEIFIKDYTAEGSTMTAPSAVIICGCTNDFQQAQSRFITDAEVTASGKSYDKYVEEMFYLQSEFPTYNNNRLIPLETINLAKIHGALRYIVQRLGTIFPNVKFFIVTPIQSTAHSLFHQRMCVRDYKWSANRLSIPVIDAWGESQLTMLWDYKDINGNDNHKLLVDNVHMANATVVQNSVNIMARFVANSIFNKFFKFY